MSHLTLKVFALILAASISAAEVRAESATPEAVVDDFIKAWNSHDMKAFDRLFTEDAIWIPLAEVTDEGRANILKDLAEAHNTWAQTTTLKQSGALKIRQISP